jgi:hypothetical protein
MTSTLPLDLLSFPVCKRLHIDPRFIVSFCGVIFRNSDPTRAHLLEDQRNSGFALSFCSPVVRPDTLEQFSSFSQRLCVFLAKVSSLAAELIFDRVKSRFLSGPICHSNRVETIAGTDVRFRFCPDSRQGFAIPGLTDTISGTDLNKSEAGTGEYRDTGPLGGAQSAIQGRGGESLKRRKRGHCRRVQREPGNQIGSWRPMFRPMSIRGDQRRRCRCDS